MGIWKEKAKLLLEGGKEKNPKRKTENLIVFLVILVITVICINTIWKKEDTKGSIPKDNNVKLAQTSSKVEKEGISIQEDSLEKRLEEILKKMSGVEDAKVLITYSETNQIVPMYNEEEKETISRRWTKNTKRYEQRSGF